jgi:hypothetical protein
MNGISIQPKKARELLQPNIGFKGIAVVGKNRQFVEASFGFKGIGVQAKQNGYAQMFMMCQSL